MTQTPEEFDLASVEEGSEGWKSLRAAYAKQNAELKRIKDEQAKQARQTEITETLTSKGLDPAMAAIIPADANPSEWIDTYGHFLNTGAATKQEPVTPPSPQEPVVVDNNDPAVNAAINQEAILAAQMQAAEQTGFATPEIIDAQMKQLSEVKTEQDLIGLIERAGGFDIG